MSIASDLRSVIDDRTKVDGPVAILLSNGVDSNSVLASVLSNGSRPYVLSFRVAHRSSTDHSAARRTASRLGLTFVDVEIPDNLTALDALVVDAIQNHGLRKKADIECWVPVKLAIDAAAALGVRTVVTGAAADGHFGLSKKAVIRAHKSDGLDNPAWLNEFRRAYFARPNPAQTRTGKLYGSKIGVEVIAPYTDPRLLDIFEDVSWRDLNKPMQKMPIRLGFPEIAAWGVGRVHTNLQLGDSGIAENFARLVTTPRNTRGYKSVIGIYNEIARTL